MDRKFRAESVSELGVRRIAGDAASGEAGEKLRESELRLCLPRPLQKCCNGRDASWILHYSADFQSPTGG